MFTEIQSILTRIKHIKPLVVNLSNTVTMDFIANGLLAVGASPVMSQAKPDIEALLPMASALVINIGTLDDTFMALCHTACQIANQLKKPIILDPVGAGATHYRTQHAQQLLESFDIAIIRGNASEIIALAGGGSNTKGVDSQAHTDMAIDSAYTLAKSRRATVVISGEVDIVVNATQHVSLYCGSPMMPQVVGTGCLLTAVVAAFHAVEPSTWQACQTSVLFYGVCGEMAASMTSKPGSFKTAFLDALSDMPQEVHYANR